jgi:hypothetical protein
MTLLGWDAVLRVLFWLFFVTYITVTFDETEGTAGKWAASQSSS